MASDKEKSYFKNPVINWIDERLPIFSMLDKEYGKFPTPKNFSYFWNFGAILMVILVVMILSGLFLAMHYTPSTDKAFGSVERIMRDVNFGWLIRYVHANGASMFFVAVYIHIFRGMYYGSYKKPREIMWITGVILFLLMMATAFMGYVLPWGQMSFWGATVITNLFSVFPLIGEGVVTWLWGGFAVENPTLNRFYALHFLLPFVIAGVVFLHVWALHVVGSNNPTGVEPKTKKDTLPFHPYYTIKDLFGLLVFLMFFGVFVFFAPNMLGHPDNYIPADPLVTPAHIVPEWYFLPFYAILRGIPNALMGVLAMFGSIMIWFLLPWLDWSPVRSARYRPLARLSILFMVVCFVLLGIAGAKSADAVLNIGPVGLSWVWISRFATLYYFAHFLVILPLLPKIEKTKPLPKSIDASMKKVALVLGLMIMPVLYAQTAIAAGKTPELPEVEFQHEGPFGTFDYEAVQRGFKVYKNVCATCHGMKYLSYRHLKDIGFTDAQVKAIAMEYTVMDGPNDEGEMYERPALPTDRFVSPYPNYKAAAAANNGAVPPDLSLMAKARPGGADYLYALMIGYEEPPEGKELLPGQYYNKYYPGHVIAMAPPLIEGIMEYDDGTEATTEQMAHDLSSFLMWAAEPKMEERKAMGVKVLTYLFVFAVLMYLVKRRVWRDVKGK